jgi:hypothetical protein
MDPQLQERLMIYGGFIPGVVSLILMIAVWYIHAFKESRVDHSEEDGDRTASQGPRWMLPLMLVVGFAGADYASNDIFHLWPDGNNYRFVHAIALIALVGILEGVVSLPMLVAFGFRFIAYAGAFWMLAEGYVDQVFGGTPVFVGSTLFAALSAALISTSIDRNSDDTPAWVDSITWIVIAGASMPILLHNHFSIGAMIPAGIIAVLVSTLFTGLIFRGLRLSRGGVTVLVGFMMTMLAGSIVQTGADYLTPVMLMGLAPIVTLIPMKTPSGVRRLIARLILLAVVLGSAGGVLYWSMSADQQGESEIDPYADYEMDS